MLDGYRIKIRLEVRFNNWFDDFRWDLVIDNYLICDNIPFSLFNILPAHSWISQQNWHFALSTHTCMTGRDSMKNAISAMAYWKFLKKYVYLIGCFGVQYRCIFYEFCSILTSPQSESKYKERAKIYSDILNTKTSHKLFIIQLLLKKESYKETLKCRQPN